MLVDATRLQYTVSTTFMCTGKPKTSVRLALSGFSPDLSTPEACVFSHTLEASPHDILIKYEEKNGGLPGERHLYPRDQANVANVGTK